MANCAAERLRGHVSKSSNSSVMVMQKQKRTNALCYASDANEGQSLMHVTAPHPF